MAKISSIIQPLVAGQNHATSLGQLLSVGRGEELYLSTAYLRKAGVTPIAKQLRKRAKTTKAFVGIANGATSLQGIQALFRTGIRIWLVDTGSRDRIFHPKFYSTKDGNEVHAIIGSANITHPGLYNNIEFGASIELDLGDRSDSEFYSSIKQALETLSTAFPDNCFSLLSLKHARKLANEGRLVDEEITPEPDAAPEARGAAPPRPERTTRRIRLPYTPAPARPRTAQPPRPSSAGAAPSGARGQTGFWKILSNWDVNPGSAPGQIQIPIQFKPFFPALRDSRDPSAPRQGRFQDTEFSVRFQDGRYNTTANGRYIVYPPGARPNSEGRFTFRDEAIFSRLRAGDMLVFRVSDDPAVAFEIERIQPGDARFGQLRGTGNARWGLLGAGA